MSSVTYHKSLDGVSQLTECVSLQNPSLNLEAAVNKAFSPQSQHQSLRIKINSESDDVAFLLEIKDLCSPDEEAQLLKKD